MNLIPKRNTLTIIYIALILIIIYLFRTFTIFENSAAKRENNTELLSCEDFEHLSTTDSVGEGWTKLVFKGTWRRIPVAFKTVNEEGHSMKKCIKTAPECLQMLRNGLIEEAKVLQGINHPNIVKLYGICMANNSSKKNGLLVELGQPIDSFSLVQKDYKTRLQLAKELTSFMVYLGSFEGGGILLPDFRLQQFVTVNDRLKLCDVDDLVFGDKDCYDDIDCVTSFKERSRFQVSCKNRKCLGLNDRLNVWRACRNIFPYLISFGAPNSLLILVDKILECKESGITSEMLEKSIHELSQALLKGQKKTII